MPDRPTYTERLTLARSLLDPPPEPGPGLADQLDAATSEATTTFQRLAASLVAHHPRWSGAGSVETFSPDGTARLAAAVMGCQPCPHLRRSGPQPVTAKLALHRLDCNRCVRTVRRPPPGDDDRCDICEARGIETFTPLVASKGPTTMIGDLCGDCAAAIIPSHVA